MGNIISAIRDDIKEYERLCAEYAEPIRMAKDGYPDCYGKHAKELKRREREKYALLHGLVERTPTDIKGE